MVYVPSTRATWTKRPQVKAPTKAIRKAFDRDALARICAMHETEFPAAYGMTTVKVDQHAPADWYAFRDNGASILAVAHLDTVSPHDQRAARFVDTAGGTVVYSRALDDRLGAYIVLELLPALGIACDWLLTVGEEEGMSTAAHFDPGDKEYDWIIEFDRGGTDVVLYQFEDEETRELVEASGAEVDFGSFSDISYLEHLEVKAFNWGVGYRDYHGARSHAWLDDTFRMVAYFLNFHRANVGNYLPHDNTRSYGGRHWWDDDAYATRGTYGNGAWWDDPADTVVDAVLVDDDEDYSDAAARRAALADVLADAYADADPEADLWSGDWSEDGAA